MPNILISLVRKSLVKIAEIIRWEQEESDIYFKNNSVILNQILNDVSVITSKPKLDEQNEF